MKKLLMLALLLTCCAAAQDTAQKPATPFTPLELAGFPPTEPGYPLFDIVEKGADTITVRHSYGETVIPRRPQRIIAPYDTAEALITLGINPLAHPGYDDLSPVLKERAPEVIFLPFTELGPDPEAVLALEPDLIIGYEDSIGARGQEGQYALMREIAPTVVFYNSTVYWQDLLRQLGDLFDRRERAEEVIADYNEQVLGLRERVAVVMGNESVTPVLFFDSPWLYGPVYEVEGSFYPSNYVSWLYQELQLTPSPELRQIFGEGGPGFGEAYFELSEELLPELQADHLIVFPGGYSGATTVAESYTEYTDKAVWQAIPAVQAGNVHVITGVNIVFGYYTALDAMERFADAIESNEAAPDATEETSN